MLDLEGLIRLIAIIYLVGTIVMSVVTRALQRREPGGGHEWSGREGQRDELPAQRLEPGVDIEEGLRPHGEEQAPVQHARGQLKRRQPDRVEADHGQPACERPALPLLAPERLPEAIVLTEILGPPRARGRARIR